MAARLHEFNRSPGDIIKIVKVHESTLRKRLIEFGDTPSSALTLDEFMTVDLEEEQDPPAFKVARKKDRERLQRLENMDYEFNELQSEIDRQLEDHKSAKGKAKNSAAVEESDANRFIRESNLSVIEECVGRNPDDPDDPTAVRQKENPLTTGLGPDIASMGLTTSFHSKDNVKKDPSSLSFENMSGEIDITDLDDEELDSYIMTEKEAQYKSNLWNKVNEKYLQEQKEKEEKRQKEKEEGKPEKKRRRATSKKNKNQGPANSAGEAIEKMLQEKRISSKINYEVLKSLNVSVGSTPSNPPKEIADDVSFVSPKIVDKEPAPPSSPSPKKTQPRIIEISKRKLNLKIIPGRKRKASEAEQEFTKEASPIPIPTPTSALDYEANKEIDEADDYMDDEAESELDPSEMPVGQALRQLREEQDNDYGFGYDEEDY